MTMLKIFWRFLMSIFSPVGSFMAESNRPSSEACSTTPTEDCSAGSQPALALEMSGSPGSGFCFPLSPVDWDFFESHTAKWIWSLASGPLYTTASLEFDGFQWNMALSHYDYEAEEERSWHKTGVQGVCCHASDGIIVFTEGITLESAEGTCDPLYISPTA